MFSQIGNLKETPPPPTSAKLVPRPLLTAQTALHRMEIDGKIDTSGIIARHFAIVGKVDTRRRMATTNLRNWPATSGDACSTIPPPAATPPAR